MAPISIRKDIRKLSQLEKDNLIKAFDAIQKLPPEDENSYFYIAGFHGAPFRGPGYYNPNWWGGYCAHGNILFPTWHRAYLLRLEHALQKQVHGVTLPYWNEIDSDTTDGPGLPEIFLTETYTFADGKSIPNPLRSYTYQKAVVDRLKSDPDTDYTKPQGSGTRRFPFTSLYGESDKVATQANNDRMTALGLEATNKYLNDNVKSWIKSPTSTIVTSRGFEIDIGVKSQYLRCLSAPNYTVFSNPTSSAQWNDDHQDDPGVMPVVALETPHNAIHVALGGSQIPTLDPKSAPIPDSRGDMGENETASFDPIFYFHHCFIDLLFWQWQTLHGQTKELEIEPGLAAYPGTSSTDGQGPTPGMQRDARLTLNSHLDPFVNPRDQRRFLTSKDVTNIEDLGYTYQVPEELPQAPLPSPEPVQCPQIIISGIDRAAISGSFTISIWVLGPDGSRSDLVGIEPILSRWHVLDCANCLTHLDVRAHMPLKDWSNEMARQAKFRVLIHTWAEPQGVSNLNGKVPKYTVVLDGEH